MFLRPDSNISRFIFSPSLLVGKLPARKMTRRAWPELGRNLGAKLRLNELVLRRAGVERQQNQRGFGRGGGDRTIKPFTNT